MYAVAITRQTSGGASDVAALATLFGADPYDMRLRLSSPVPIIVGHAADADQATEWLRAVRALGYGSIACDLERVPTGNAVLTARSFELQPDAITVHCEDGRDTRLAYDEILALVHAMLATESQTLNVTTEKKLSAMRVLATSGLSRNTTKTTQTRSQDQEHEPALYLVRKDGSDPIVLRQNRMQYEGLGSPLPPTRLGCFQDLLGRLRAAAPEALFDNRLLSQKRKPNAIDQARDRVATKKKQETSSTITQTNAGATDLAVYLLAVAHLRGQL